MFLIAVVIGVFVKICFVCCCPTWSLMNGCSVPINSTSFPYKELFHEPCQRHDVCYSCGEMHGWSKDKRDHAFYNDMLNNCRITQSRKRRHLNDFVSLLRHKFKRSMNTQISVGDKFFFMSGTICKWAAGIYFHTVRLFGNCFYASPSSSICNQQCAIDSGKPNF